MRVLKVLQWLSVSHADSRPRDIKPAMNNKTLLLSFILLSSACNQNLAPSEVNPAGTSSAIIGGTIASSEVESSTVKIDFCTGVLISPNLVITAAHCLDGSRTTHQVVFNLANSSFKKLLKKRTVTTSATSAFIAHPKYSEVVDKNNDWYISNDIAIVKLKDKAPASAKPALIYDQQVKPGQKLILAGYGLTSENGPRILTDRAYAVEIPVASSSGQRIIMDQSSGKGSFSGDSGGPAYLKTTQGLVLVGTTSGPVQNADLETDSVKTPVLYMKTSEFKEFILTQAKALGAIPPKFSSEVK
jgi:secreted trypsin-like serine protease